MSDHLHLAVKAAIFLDRDGVLIEDVHLLTDVQDISIPNNVPEALSLFYSAGYKIIVVSNQTVVSRGMATEQDVQLINDHIQNLLIEVSAPPIDGFYICPHHPNATLDAYRVECECRKPEPGLLFEAANEHRIDLSRSFMIGDRITDIVAGAKAKCRTVLVQTGKHIQKPIQTAKPLDESIRPDHICPSLFEAAQWILE